MGLCYFSLNYFWLSNAHTQNVLTENGFWHEIATHGHSRSFILQSITGRQGAAYNYNIAGLVSKVSEKVTIEVAENCRRRQPHRHLKPPLWGTPGNIRIHRIFPETRVIGLQFCRWKFGSILNFCSWFQKTHIFCNRVRIGRSRSSKIDNFGPNRKRVCDFLLGCHGNYGLSCTVSEIRRHVC